MTNPYDRIKALASDEGPLAVAELSFRMQTLGCPDVDDGSIADALKEARAELTSLAGELGNPTVTPPDCTVSGVELPEPDAYLNGGNLEELQAEENGMWMIGMPKPDGAWRTPVFKADQLCAYADARVAAATKALKDWRFEVCERLGFSCAAGAEWSPDQIWQHVTDVEIALNQRAESAERERDAVSETLASVIADTAKVLGCEPDNEAILQAIGKLRKDAERWREFRGAGSEITQRLHYSAPSNRNAIIDAAIAAERGENAN